MYFITLKPITIQLCKLPTKQDCKSKYPNLFLSINAIYFTENNCIGTLLVILYR